MQTKMYNDSQEENPWCCRCGLAVSGGIDDVCTRACGCGAVWNTYLCNAGSCCSRRPLYLRRMQKGLSVKQWFRSETRLQAHFVCVKIKVLLQTSTQKRVALACSQRTVAADMGMENNPVVEDRALACFCCIQLTEKNDRLLVKRFFLTISMPEFVQTVALYANNSSHGTRPLYVHINDAAFLASELHQFLESGIVSGLRPGG